MAVTAIDTKMSAEVQGYLRKAEAQDAEAQFYLGEAFYYGKGVPQDRKQAAEWYHKAAKQGHAQAQCNYGVFLEEDLKDLQGAIVWYDKAAAQNNSDAQYYLGIIFDQGLGREQDKKQAVVWYRKAAEQGHAKAQYALGLCFENGQGVTKDERQAVEWYRKAADQGHAKAQFNLGCAFRDGRGVAEDERQAVEWYRKAAEQGLAQAQYNLGLRFECGLGVTKDLRQAVEWYRPAAEQGHANAKRELERLQASLPTASLATSSISEKPTALAKESSSAVSLTSPEPERKKQDEKQKAETKTQQEKAAVVSLPTVPRIAWKELTTSEHVLIGNGSYGDVYKGQWQGAPVAIKVLQLKTLSQPVTEEFEHESDMMMKCQHPSIVRLYGVCTEPGHLAMVMDYLPTSLRSRLQDGKDFPWLKRLLIAEDMAKGLVYLHSRNILHRDLKSFNILLDENERARIADFGLAKVKLEIGSTSTKTHKAVGSLRWRAPELFDFPPPPSNAASDVYSLGVLLWELVTRRLPYSYSSDESMVGMWIGSGKKEKIPDDCPKAFAEIIQDCWAAPDKRPKASEVVARLEPLVKEAATKESSLQKPLTIDEFRMFTADFAVFAARQEASSNPTFMPLTPFRNATSSASQAGTSPLGTGQESKSTVAKP